MPRLSPVRLLILGILTFEIVLPAVMLIVSEPPRSYSWSMYTETSTNYRYVGTTRDDKKEVVDPAELGVPWNAIHYGVEGLEMLCERHAELGSIARYYNGKIERIERC